MCKRVLKEDTNTVGGIPFFKIGTFGKKEDAYISKELFAEYKTKYKYPKKGEVLISAAGTIGKTVVFDGEPSYFQDSNIVWIDNDETLVLNSYLKLIYMTNPWKVVAGGTISRLYNDIILNTVVNIPSILKQKEIVSILNKFESLSMNILVGLPAEIAYRRQQYEYYRDKLLIFKEVNR